MSIKKQSSSVVEFDSGFHFDVASGIVSESEKFSNLTFPITSIKKNPLKIEEYTTSTEMLQISLTDRCNMGCTYCSFRAREGVDNKPVNMSITTAKQAISFFKKNKSSKTRYTRVDFGLAGEPLLRRKAHPVLINEIQKTFGEDQDIKRLWVGTVTTNGTLGLKDEIANSIAPPMDISCDGPKHVHDDVRIYVDGKGTYDDVSRVAKKVLSLHPSIGVSAVLTGKHTNFVEIFRHLRDELGFSNIYMKPVNLSPLVEWGLNQMTLDAFKKGYSDLVDHFISLPKENLLKDLLALNNEDYFMRFFYRVKDRAHQVYRCGAGKSGYYVDTNGKFYACAHFIGKSGWHIGDLDTGFDKEKVDQFKKLHVDTREPCKSCWARYLCGGGCYYQAAITNNDIEKPDLVKCELILHLCSESIRLLAFLKQNHPDVLDALPKPYYLHADDLDKSSEDIYMPHSTFKESDYEEFQLIREGYAESTISTNDASLIMKLNQTNDAIELQFDGLNSLPCTEIGFWLLDLDDCKIKFSDLTHLNYKTFGQYLKVDGDSVLRLRETELNNIREIPYKHDKWEKLNGAVVESKEGGVLTIKLPFADLWESKTPKLYGFNVFINLADGGKVRLNRYEPYSVINSSHLGFVIPFGGEFNEHISRPGFINLDTIENFEPVGRWLGRMANVC